LLGFAGGAVLDSFAPTEFLNSDLLGVCKIGLFQLLDDFWNYLACVSIWTMAVLACSGWAQVA
jgi:hypothetical protein